MADIKLLNEALSDIISRQTARVTARPGNVLLKYLFEKNRTVTQNYSSIEWPVQFGADESGVKRTDAPGVDMNRGTERMASIVDTNGERYGTHSAYGQFTVNMINVQDYRARAINDLANIFSTQVSGHIDKMLDRINTALYSGVGTPADMGIYGLSYVTDNTHGYANIDSTQIAYDAWKAPVQGPAVPDALTEAEVLDFDALLKSTVNAEAIVVNSQTLRKYDALFKSEGGTFVYKTTDAGFPVVDFGIRRHALGGRPFLEDPSCPTGRMYAIDPDQLTVFSWDRTPEEMRAEALQQSIRELSYATGSVLGMNVSLKELPIGDNMNIRRFQIQIIPQFRVFNRASGVALLRGISMA